MEPIIAELIVGDGEQTLQVIGSGDPVRVRMTTIQPTGRVGGMAESVTMSVPRATLRQFIQDLSKAI